MKDETKCPDKQEDINSSINTFHCMQYLKNVVEKYQFSKSALDILLNTIVDRHGHFESANFNATTADINVIVQEMRESNLFEKEFQAA